MHDVVKESVFALLPSAAACVLATGVKNMQTFLLCVGGLTALFSAMRLAEDIGYEAMHYLFDCVLDVIDAPQPTESTAVSSPFAPAVPWGLKSLPLSFKPDSRRAL